MNALVGTIEEVYFDEPTDRPQWMVVRTGLFALPVAGTVQVTPLTTP